MGSLPEDEFVGLPPFPQTVPTAPLLRMSLAKLLAHDGEEEDRLWSACCDLGFFYLDLRGRKLGEQSTTTYDRSTGHADGLNGHAKKINGIKDTAGIPQEYIDGESLLSDADQLFEVAKELYELPIEEKIKYDFAGQGSYFGYKGYGSGIIDKEGNRDRNEFYNVSKDDILEISERLPAPHVFEKHRSLFKSYITSSHALISFILQLLEPRLKLQSGSLTKLHRLTAVSGDQVRMIKAPPQPPEDRSTALGAHTDFGSVTVLFNRVGGLQVRLPEGVSPIPAQDNDLGTNEPALCEGGWCYVHPLPGHAIISLGDALVKFSAGILRSNIHRVVSPPGKQADTTRYSLVYFSRPGDDVILKALRESPLIAEKAGPETDDENISSKDWILRRALGRRKGGKYEDSAGTEETRGAKG